MSLRGATVDLDDTLFAQQEWLAGAWEAVAEEGGRRGLAGPRLLTSLRAVAAEGSDRGGIIDRAVAAVGADPDRHRDALVATFAAHAPRSLPCYPGAADALRALRAQIPVVCVTDGNPRIQRAKLAALGLGKAFDGVVISDELGGRHLRKPDSAPFRAAVRMLGLAPEDVVHIGDRPAKDVQGAEAAGLRCIRVRTGEYAGQDGATAPWAEAPSFTAAVGICLAEIGTAEIGGTEIPGTVGGPVRL